MANKYICSFPFYIAGGRATDGASVVLPRPRLDDDESIADNWSTQSVVSDDTSWPGSGRHSQRAIRTD